MDLLLGYLENLGALPLHIVDGLAGGVYQQPVLTLGHGHAALRLHESMLLPGGLVLAGDHILGVLYGLVGIATHQVCPAHDVAVGVDEGGVSLESVKGVGDGSEFGVVHLHQGAELFQLALVGGDHHGQDVAHIAGNISLAHDHIPVLLDVAGLVAGHVFPQQYGQTVGVGAGFGGVYPVYQGPGIFGVHGLGIDHALYLQVIGKEAAAVDLLLGIQALGVLVHVQLLRGGGDGLALPEKFRSHKYGFLYLLIAGAAAEVAFYGLLHVFSGGIQIHVQQALG